MHEGVTFILEQGKYELFDDRIKTSYVKATDLILKMQIISVALAVSNLIVKYLYRNL